MTHTQFVRKAQKLQFLPAPLLFLSLLASGAHAQITPSADSYTNTVDATTNYGSKTLLDVDGASQTTYIQFNLASIPATASISQATLKLYVNGVTTAGSFNVDYINSAWSESTIDASNAPPLGSAIASNVNVTTAEKNQYILINVTTAVQAWLSGSEANNGLALVANSTFNATFDSKENTTTSHAPELDIAFSGGEGTITGVTTASGSGLTGGGTSGTLNLSLTNTCATNQVLQWSGSAWACASVGTGTITGVTAGTDLTGGGTSGAVMLNVDTTKVPQLAASNTFTGNQTVNGNLSATGIVSGTSFEIGSNLFGFGSVSNGNAFLGFAGNNTTTGTYNTASGVNALLSNTSGIENTAIGYAALQGNTAASANTATGYGALQSNSGSFNTATGVAALFFNTTGYQNTANGVAALYFNTTGSYNAATGLNALKSNTTGNNNTANGYAALNSNTTGSYNTAVGTSALQNNTTYGPNDAFGYQALYSNTGYQNAAFGYQASYSNATAGANAAFGYQALYSNTEGTNAAFGYQALYNTIGTGNAAFGYQALGNNNFGVGNSAFGTLALYSGGGGFYTQDSSAFGYAALYSNTIGTNDAFGWKSLNNNTNGSGNAAFGYVALQNNTSGQSNAAFGQFALTFNTTGSNNTGVGYDALSTTTGTDLTCIGYECNAPGNISNSTSIGAHAVVEQSNSLVLGGTGQYAVKVGIGTTTPSNVLTIAQGAGHPVSDSWETYSSRRWKTNIQTLPNALAKVQQLRGVSYDLKDTGKHEIGVIAEEVGAVVPELVSYEANGKDARGVDYSRLTALLIEATKEQQRQFCQQHAELAKALRQIKQQQSLLRAQSSALRSLKAEVREARQALQQVKAQVAASQPTTVASK